MQLSYFKTIAKKIPHLNKVYGERDIRVGLCFASQTSSNAHVIFRSPVATVIKRYS
jgi:hypothetical protein